MEQKRYWVVLSGYPAAEQSHRSITIVCAVDDILKVSGVANEIADAKGDNAELEWVAGPRVLMADNLVDAVRMTMFHGLDAMSESFQSTVKARGFRDDGVAEDILYQTAMRLNQLARDQQPTEAEILLEKIQVAIANAKSAGVDMIEIRAAMGVVFPRQQRYSTAFNTDKVRYRLVVTSTTAVITGWISFDEIIAFLANNRYAEKYTVERQNMTSELAIDMGNAEAWLKAHEVTD